MLTADDKEKIENLIIELGGPYSTILHLVESSKDKELLERQINYIVSIRHVSKKTVLGNETIQEFFQKQLLNIILE